MPPKYTKAQKAAYAKRMRKNKKTAVKTVVAQQRKKKVELKDRISNQTLFEEMYQNGDAGTQVSSVTGGVANTYTVIPSSWADPFTSGTYNGQIVGTEITPKYLNLKMKLGFDFLRRVVYVQPNGVDPHVQRYDITILQGWIKKDLRSELDKELTNPNSGWELPSFESKAVYTNSLNTLVNREMFNNAIEPEFLMYRQKAVSNIKIIRRIKVKGAMDENLVTNSVAGAPTDSPAEDVTPEQNFTFNWDLQNFNKTKLAPIGVGSATPTHVLGYSWIPFVQVQVARRITENIASSAGPKEHRSYLTVKSVNHFTYADS